MVLFKRISFLNKYLFFSNVAPNATDFEAPTFRFVQEQPASFVLAVEDTAAMNMQRRWEFVRKAVRRTVVYDVPDETHMALVVFNSVAKTVAPLSLIESSSDVRQRIGSSLPRNPSTVPESHKCVLCGLQESLRALGPNAKGSTIILVTTGAGTSLPYQAEEMNRLVKDSGVRIIPVVYPKTEASSVDQLSALRSGRFFTVIDEGVGNDSKVSMMVSLMDALLSSLQLVTSGAPFISHTQAFPGGISQSATGTFALDESQGPNARFSVFYYDLNHVGNAIKLTTPSGNVMASVNMQEEDGDANVIFVNVPKAERGLWHYEVENRADSHQGLYVQVLTHKNENRDLHLGLKATKNSRNQTIFYAQIKEDDLPILGARVQAKLTPLGTNATGYPYESFFVDLLDNGIGGKFYIFYSLIHPRDANLF